MSGEGRHTGTKEIPRLNGRNNWAGYNIAVQKLKSIATEGCDPSDHLQESPGPKSQKSLRKRFFGTSEDRAFQIPSENCAFGLVHGQFLPCLVVVQLPNFGSQCEEPSENYKVQK